MKNAAAMEARINAVLRLLVIAVPIAPRRYFTTGGVSKVW